MKIFLILLFSSFFLTGLAQHNNYPGNVSVVCDPRIDKLAEEYPEIAGQIHSMEGFRIQIFFDSGNQSKNNATNARASFIRQYPNVEAYITFREPYYRVRVGDFRTKLEADGFRKRILSNYPHAFTVNDQINPPPIN
jgi:hypothetical protein